MSLAPTNHIMWKNRRYLNVSMTLMALRYLGSYLMSLKVCDFSTCLMWLKALVVCYPKWQVRIWFDLRPEWTPSWSSIFRPFPPLAIFGAGDFPIPTPFFSPHWPWITRGFSGFLRKSWKIKRIIEKNRQDLQQLSCRDLLYKGKATEELSVNIHFILIRPHTQWAYLCLMLFLFINRRLKV